MAVTKEVIKSSINNTGDNNEESTKNTKEEIKVIIPNRKNKIEKKKISMDNFKRALESDDHKIDLIDLYHRYNTDPNTGLTDAQAREIRKYDGSNILSPLETIPKWVKFCRQMFGNLAILLWISAILCFILHGLTIVTDHEDASNDNLWFGLALIIVVIVTGYLSYYQEDKSSRIIGSFKDKAIQRTLVIRKGVKKYVKSEDLVVGDIVEISFGDRVSADIRILESNGFKVDSSSLNGEAESQLRSAECTGKNIFETANLAFLDIFAVEGTAKGLVIRTGDRCVTYCIADLASDLSAGDTPIAKEITQFIQIITDVAIFFGISFFIIALSFGYSFIESIILLLAIILVNVPKGVLGTVTVCLTLAAKRMAKKNCLVKNLEVVETFGSTSIICVDKTGTLTLNKMTVTHMWFDGHFFETDLTENQDCTSYDKKSLGFLSLIRCAILCNQADFKQNSKNLTRPVLCRECHGDTSDSALLKYAELSIGNVDKIRQANRKVYEIPFNSTDKYQLSIHEMRTGNKNNDKVWPYLLVMKGAPERIFERCSRILINGKDIEIDDYWRDQYQRACLGAGSLGERIFGFCDLRLSSKEYPYGYQFNADKANFPTKNLRFLGLMSMIDPPREAVPESIAICRSAGIKVIMITGDHPTTAKTIARAVGIFSEDTETVEDVAERLDILTEDVNLFDAAGCVIPGDDLKHMSPTEIDAILRNYREIIFARTSPEQKLMIIEECQRQDAIVAMIGDGLNDSLALKQADIGVAMGIAGSNVSKQVADMILLDDNFASIAMSVEEGRLIFDNLKKSIAYTLTSNISQITPFLLYLLMDLPLVLGIITMLCIDLGTNMIPAILLGYEKMETDIMMRRPRNPQYDRLVSDRLILMAYGQIGFIQSCAGFFTYFMVMAENGFLPSRLLNLRKSWESKHVNDLEDSYGQEWTYEHRKQLELTCHAAFFVTIVICQLVTLIICKTRRKSIVHQGMKNRMLNFGIGFEIILTAIIFYILYSSTGLNIYPWKFLCLLLPVLPYGFLILIYDEMRKYAIRRNPGGWVERETYY